MDIFFAADLVPIKPLESVISVRLCLFIIAPVVVQDFLHCLSHLNIAGRLFL